MQSDGRVVICRSSPNIALVKYWGKSNEQLILPYNDSLSLTLNSADLATITKLQWSEQYDEDLLILNGERSELTGRIKNMFKMVRDRLKNCSKNHFKITSENTFPTASGMASSASGLSALASCLDRMFPNLFSQKQVAIMARMGSGSACRSMFGGLVRWKSWDGSQKIQEDISEYCIPFPIMPSSCLSHLAVLIISFGSNKKETSSTDGMRRSMLTSELMKLRPKIAASRADIIINSLQNHDHKTFFSTIIRDSNQFHAICLDSYPPIIYLNDNSHIVMHYVDNILNKILPCPIAYTFDAGPHAFLILNKEQLADVILFFTQLFEIQQNKMNEKAKKIINSIDKPLSEELTQKIVKVRQQDIGLYLTDVGTGPQYLN